MGEALNPLGKEQKVVVACDLCLVSSLTGEVVSA